MNERIQELAEQAHEYVDSSSAKNLRKVFEKKFAELIVQECAEVARQHNLATATRSYMIHNAIKKHFRVE